MKILICSTSNALGGLERRIEDETRLLTALGHEVVVATPRFAEIESWKPIIQRAGGRHIIWAPYKFVERQHFAAPFRWLALASLPALRRERFDFAHLTLPYNFIGMSMAYLLSRANIPFVVGMHCKCGNQRLSARGRGVVADAMRSMVGGYAVSQPVNESFMRLYGELLPPARNLVTVTNGIDIDRFKPDAAIRATLRQSLGLDESNFVVVFCGRIQAMKRPLFAVRVFAKLVAQYPRARLLVVGNGPDAAALKTEIDVLGIQHSVILVGHVADTAPYYAASDCYLSTSINEEGFSLSTAEALASGLPAVLPNDDVYSSVYSAAQAVQLCDQTSPTGWDSALLSIVLSAGHKRARVSKDAREYVAKNLTTEIMQRKLTLFYEGVFSQLDANSVVAQPK